jgi:putative ABC transport system permease protein
MLMRVLAGSLRLEPRKVLLSLAALTIGATLASAFLSLYFELPQQISGEFRALGPNLVVAPRNVSETLPVNIVEVISSGLPDVPLLPWLYAVGEAEGKPVILAGADLDRIAGVHPSWDGVPEEGLSSNSVLAGAKAAQLLGWTPGETVHIRYGGQDAVLQLADIVSTGGSEDSQLLLPLRLLQELTGQQGHISMIQIAARGSASEIEATWRRIGEALSRTAPAAEVRPLRPVLESEAHVVMKVRWLMLGLAAVVLALVILSVLTTVSGRIVDRRRDIGVMKALGGSDRGIARFFLAESAAQALLAGAIGCAIGFLLAQWAAHRMFGSAVAWRWDVVASVLALTVAAAIVATALPARWIHRMDAAVILRGE